jgi:hypothetical protein
MLLTLDSNVIVQVSRFGYGVVYVVSLAIETF